MDNLFCDLCDNYFITKITYSEDGESTNFVKYCRSCDFSKEHDDKNESIYQYNNSLDTIKKTHIVNKYTAIDNTLPRALGINCPNKSCPVKKADIRYIKYDSDNMKYIYICTDCHKANIEPNIW